MSMIDVIRKEMMTAMKNKDKERKESLFYVIKCIKNAQIDKREDLTEAEETQLSQKRSNRQKRQWILALLIVQISLMNAKQD